MARRLGEGDPAAEILRVAREINCDMIIMGTHGATGLQRLLMGSVAEGVARAAICPVVILKTPFLHAGAPGGSSQEAREPALV
jgi:nucleotide-binding universal stress UspA family protein